jgi:hypothetical protein
MVEIRALFPANNQNLLTNPMREEQKDDSRFSRTRITSAIRTKITQTHWEVEGPKLLGVACGVVLAGMLVAGLWPFHSPRNQVTWVRGGNGLHFGRRGTILSSTEFEPPDVPADAPCSLEIWFEPARPWSSGTLFSFYAPRASRQFSLCQSNGYLALRSDTRKRRYRTLTTTLDVEELFGQRMPSFVTVTSTGAKTSVYIDGALARAATNFPLSGRDFGGELVIANLPKLDNSWSGLLRGLALYDEALSPAQVVHHYETWTKNGRPDVSGNERAVAVYLFDERAGRVIHNQVPSGTNLYIPERYMVLDQAFLRAFWEEYEPSWGYWKDVVLINIVGFIPFGVLFCAYYSLARRIKRPALVTILLGFTVSLTIECLQALLPTRGSGTTDLITNTLGTCLGVWIYRSDFWRAPWARI